MRKKIIWETIETLYHATIEVMSNRKRNKLVAHNQECKKIKIKNEGYMHFFIRHETCLSILTIISCNFQFMNTHTHTHTHSVISILSIK